MSIENPVKQHLKSTAWDEIYNNSFCLNKLTEDKISNLVKGLTEDIDNYEQQKPTLSEKFKTYGKLERKLKDLASFVDSYRSTFRKIFERFTGKKQYKRDLLSVQKDLSAKLDQCRKDLKFNKPVSNLEKEFVMVEQIKLSSFKKIELNRSLKDEELEDIDQKMNQYEVDNDQLQVSSQFMADLGRADYYVNGRKKDPNKQAETLRDIFFAVGRDSKVFTKVTQLMYQKSLGRGFGRVSQACKENVPYEDQNRKDFPLGARQMSYSLDTDDGDIIITAKAKYNIAYELFDEPQYIENYMYEDQVIYNLTKNTIEEKTFPINGPIPFTERW